MKALRIAPPNPELDAVAELQPHKKLLIAWLEGEKYSPKGVLMADVLEEATDRLWRLSNSEFKSKVWDFDHATATLDHIAMFMFGEVAEDWVVGS